MIEADKRELCWVTAKMRGLRVFAETGTFKGDMVAHMMADPDIESVYSIELSPELYLDALDRLQGVPRRGRLTLLCGDSAAILPATLTRIKKPTLFWLDAHPGEIGTAGTYGKTPLANELSAIRDWNGTCVVLIDDVRLFGEPGWPTLAQVESAMVGWSAKLVDDVLMLESP